MPNLPALLTALLLVSTNSQAADYVWLIGGGPNLENSQAQIEQNVMWAREVINKTPGERLIRIYFTDGGNPAKDITEWRSPDETPATMQPLARVFNSYWTNGEHYRNHRLGRVDGGTEAGKLRAALKRDFETLGAVDRALIVFNGHGDYDENDTTGNTLSLWNSTEMTVGELDELLSGLAPEVTVRFIFTQCYAGAFARLARPGTNRCGFLAEAEDQPAEGCSAAIDMGDYQDFSTYFFAALAGRGRDGRALVVDPDRNGDGDISLREAHLYTLLASGSSDLPRSTSEVYLEQWLPWYLRWPKWLAADANNDYADLFRELAVAAGIDARQDLRSALRPQLAHLHAARADLIDQQERLSREIPELRRAIREEVLERWPEARNPYTDNYRRFLEQALPLAQQHILSHRNYGELAAKQNRYWDLEQDLLDNERAFSRLERIRRLAHLARTRALFENYASQEQKRRYAQLLACEEQGL